MEKKLFYLIVACFLSNTNYLNAQTVATDNVSTVKNNKTPSNHRFNFFKINLMGIVIKNYSVQYERVLSRKISIAVSYRIMPSTTIPFKDQIIKASGTSDANTKATLEKFRLSNMAITPEIRIYLSKQGYGHGFYIAPFYRYASFKTNDMIFTYQGSNSVEGNISMAGKLTSNTGGILLGFQKYIGKHVCIDTWLLGPHYGSATGEFNGTTDNPLTTQEQADLRQQLTDINIPLTNKTVTVTANSAALKLDGPWAGIRIGLSVGVRF
jgi:hypothetical protein